MTNLPTNPTRTELLERYWYDFLKFQQHQQFNRKKSGFGVPKADYSEQAFWEFYVNERMESDASQDV